MITEDYVSFETAKLLKEKGFNKDTYTMSMYDENGNAKDILLLKAGEKPVLRPTLQMAMKWLREKHNKIIVPGISLDDRTSSTINHYIVGIWYIPENNGGAFCYTSPTPYGGYPSFEEACEAGIKYCLENLI
jgi:hypothetical protein